MESRAITNVLELQAEIQRLKRVEAERKAELGRRFSSPSAIFSSVKSLFPKKEGKRETSGFLHPDLLSLVSRFVIPLTLNKTIFRHSNLLIKALVNLGSQKLAGQVTSSSAETLLSKGKALYAHFFSKKNNTKIIVHE